MVEITVALVTAFLTRAGARRRVRGLTLVLAFMAVVAAVAAVRGVASVLFAAHVLVLLTLGCARHHVATHPQWHRPDTFDDAPRAERRARQMAAWARITIFFSLLLLLQQMLLIMRNWRWNLLNLAIAAGCAVTAALADVFALTNQRMIADRLVVALRLRNVAEATTRRTPARHALANSEGVAQPPFALATSFVLVLAATCGLLIVAGGFEQQTVGDLQRRFFGGAPAAPPPTAAPPTLGPSIPPAPPPAVSPTSPSAQDICGMDYVNTIRSDAPQPVSGALVEAFNRVGATVIGCPLARSRRVGHVWVLEAGTNGRRRGLVVSSLRGVAHAVPAPRDELVLEAALGTPRLASVGPVRSTGSGDYQINFFTDDTCSITLRRVFRDQVTVVEPAAARVLMSLAVARYQFPYVVEALQAADGVIYEVKFEYSSTSATIVYDAQTRQVVNAAELGVTPSGPCANEESFERVAEEFKRRFETSLASRSPRG